jgi:hypothetical protein
MRERTPAKHIKKAFVALAVLLSIFVGIPRDAMAQADDSVSIIVYVIEASDGVPGVDPEIKPLVEQFHNTFRYSTYKLISKVPKKIRMGEESTVKIPGEREMHIGALGEEGGRIRLKVRITKKLSKGKSRDVLDTEFRLGKGASMVIGGYDHNNAKLILAISSDT